MSVNDSNATFRCGETTRLMSGLVVDCDLSGGHEGDHRHDFGEGIGPIFWPNKKPAPIAAAALPRGGTDADA